MKKETTVLIIKPGASRRRKILLKIYAFIDERRFSICLQQEVRLTVKFCKEFYPSHKKAPYFEEMLKYLTSDRSVVFILEGSGVVHATRQLAFEIRAEYGKTGKDTDSVVHATDLEINTGREKKIIWNFFDQIIQSV
jgi:nucleoside diphosphate kinase